MNTIRKRHAAHTTVRAAAMTVLSAVSALSALSVLSACSGSGDAGPTGRDEQVASVPSARGDGGKTGESGKDSTASDSGEGPAQLRLDMTEAEKLKMWSAWGQCLKDRGVPTTNGKAGLLPAGRPEDHPDAFADCEKKRPVQPKRMDPDKNPHYMDDYRVHIRCLNDRGLAVVGLPDGSGWNFAEEPGRILPDTPQADAAIHACELEAFSDGE